MYTLWFRRIGLLCLLTSPLLPQTLQVSAPLYPLTNDPVTGTALNHLAKLTTNGQATNLTTADMTGIIGIVRLNAGKAGQAGVVVFGQTLCAFDGATTAGHYVQASSTDAGDCHDAGSNFPTSGQVLGRVLATGSVAATAPLLLVPENRGAAANGGTNATAFSGVPLTPASVTDGQAWVYDANSSSFVTAAVPYWRKYTVSYTQLTGLSGNTGTVVLFARAARQKLCGVSTYVTSAYTAPGLAQMSLTVGDSNGTTNQYTPIAKSVLDTSGADFNVMGSPFGSANVTATFTASGAVLSGLTAGAVDIDICVANEP